MCTVVVLMLNGSLVVVEKNSNPFFSPPLPPGVVCASLELKKRLLRRLSSMESDFNSLKDNVARCSTTPSPTLTQVAVRLPKRQTESHSALPRMWTKAMFVRNPKTLSKSIFY